MKIKMPEKFNHRGSRVGFLEDLEREHLEEEIIETLTVKIPRLWQIEFTDADETDLPSSLLRLINELTDHCGMEFGLEEDDEDEG